MFKDIHAEDPCWLALVERAAPVRRGLGIISTQLKPNVCHFIAKKKGQICVRFSIQRIKPTFSSTSGQSQVLHHSKPLTGKLMTTPHDDFDYLNAG